MTNSDKPNNLFLHMGNCMSVKKALNTKGNITKTSKEINWWSFNKSFAGCLENIIKL